MVTLSISTSINAPIERVFDLARSIDLHTCSTAKTGERAIAGMTSGLIGLNEEVTWRARHFGVWQSLTVQIIAYDRPFHFADEMLQGAFKRMRHDHYFESINTSALMRDEFSFEAPYGILGRMVEVVVLKNYMRRFLVARNQVLKSTAESNDWARYILAR
jgi:ligand-binding SRPBCC domain-containing protein